MSFSWRFYPKRLTITLHSYTGDTATGLSVLLKDTSTTAGIEPLTPWFKDGPADHWPTVADEFPSPLTVISVSTAAQRDLKCFDIHAHSPKLGSPYSRCAAGGSHRARGCSPLAPRWRPSAACWSPRPSGRLGCSAARWGPRWTWWERHLSQRCTWYPLEGQRKKERQSYFCHGIIPLLCNEIQLPPLQAPPPNCKDTHSSIKTTQKAEIMPGKEGRREDVWRRSALLLNHS